MVVKYWLTLAGKTSFPSTSLQLAAPYFASSSSPTFQWPAGSPRPTPALGPWDLAPIPWAMDDSKGWSFKRCGHGWPWASLWTVYEQCRCHRKAGLLKKLFISQHLVPNRMSSQQSSSRSFSSSSHLVRCCNLFFGFCSKALGKLLPPVIRIFVKLRRRSVPSENANKLWAHIKTNI